MIDGQGSYAEEVARRLAEIEARGEAVDDPDPPSAAEIAALAAVAKAKRDREVKAKLRRSAQRAKRACHAARVIHARQREVRRIVPRVLAAVERETGVAVQRLREGPRGYGDVDGVRIARRVAVWALHRLGGLGLVETGEALGGSAMSSTCKALAAVELRRDPLQARVVEAVRARLAKGGLPC